MTDEWKSRERNGISRVQFVDAIYRWHLSNSSSIAEVKLGYEISGWVVKTKDRCWAKHINITLSDLAQEPLL